MNSAILKSPAFWLTAITTICGLLMSQGLVLSGSTLDHIVGWILALAGVVGGHSAVTPVTPAAQSGN
jgi:hypothetical protein